MTSKKEGEVGRGKILKPNEECSRKAGRVRNFQKFAKPGRGGRGGLLIFRRAQQQHTGRPRQRHPPGAAPVRHWQAPAEASLRAKKAGDESRCSKGLFFYLLVSTLRPPVNT